MIHNQGFVDHVVHFFAEHPAVTPIQDNWLTDAGRQVCGTTAGYCDSVGVMPADIPSLDETIDDYDRFYARELKLEHNYVLGFVRGWDGSRRAWVYPGKTPVESQQGWEDGREAYRLVTGEDALVAAGD